MPVPTPVAPKPPEPITPQAPVEKPKQSPVPAPQIIFKQPAEKIKKETVSLEQRIGTRWVLIAGVITVFISAGFFLKFAYEHYWIGPWGKICIVAVAGLISLAVGEITRRRGYGITAKGTTALGFALLYAADFAAYRYYELIGSIPSFAIAIAITIAAMAYAVALDEVVAAFLALFGGFITPVLVSKGENMPVPLFGYVLILSVGAMLCAYYRKWRTINLLAFVGTLALYCGWFEKFFRVQLHGEGPAEQMAIAICWLGIFFAVYLVLPLLYGLVNRTAARKDDVWLVIINACWTFYYLSTILFHHYRTSLAIGAAGLSAAHLAMLGIVYVRCREDVILRRSLLVLGLAFLTTAIPLYWKMNAAIMGWAIEGAAVVFIGIRYRSIITQLGGAAALTLACAKLVWQLPLHLEPFRIVFNAAFGVWVFATAALWFCHFFYKKDSHLPEDASGIIAQIYYAAAAAVLFIAATLEWAAHCNFNLSVGYDLHYIARGQVIIFAAAVMLLAVRQICPKGMLTEIMSLITLVIGAAYTGSALPGLHTESFLIFLNWDFGAVMVFVLAILFCHIKYRIAGDTLKNQAGNLSQLLYAILVLVLFFAATSEWAFHCKYNLLAGSQPHYISRGQSIILAAAALLFAIRPLCPAGKAMETLTFVTLAAGIAYICYVLFHLHTAKFLIFLNWDFAAVFVFLIALLACHIKYRSTAESAQSDQGLISQVIYAGLGLTFIAAIAAEWYWNRVFNYQESGYSAAMFGGQLIVFTISVLGFVIRPLCPEGLLSKVIATALAATGLCFAMILYASTHEQSFLIFANLTFIAAIVLAAAVITSAYLLYLRKDEEAEGKYFSIMLSLLGVIFLWVVLSEEIYEYWRCRNQYAGPLTNWHFIASMWMSVAWAIYGLLLLIIGFWKNLKMLRYFGLCVLGVLLLKAFIIDMSEVSTIYRILAFLATGITLVGVSYLYQFLKKKGFFETAVPKDTQE
jgi:uncharacterized membrane protein